MKKKLIIMIILSVMILTITAIFAGCDNNTQDIEDDGGIYIPPRDPSEIISGEIPQYNTKEDCEGLTFYDDYGIKYLIKDGMAHIIAYKYNCDIKGEIVVKSKVECKGFEFELKEIPEYAFYDESGITKIVIEEGIEKIGRYAFFGCSSLEELVIPNSVKEITLPLANTLDNLKSLTIPFLGKDSDNPCKLEYLVTYSDNLQILNITSDGDIVSEALCRYDNLKELNILGNTQRIYDKAIYDCSGIKIITIPESVIFMGENFQDMDCVIRCETNKPSLGWATYWNSNNYIVWDCNNNDKMEDGRRIAVSDEFVFAIEGDSAEAMIYSQKDNNRDVIIPETANIGNESFKVKQIGTELFKNMQSIDSVNLPDSVEVIKEYAFAYSSIQNIKFSENLKTIEEYAFYECKNLSQINLPEGLTTLNESAFAFSSVSEVQIPSTLEVIGKSAFHSCKNLTYINIPYGVKSIDNNAFYYSGLKEVVLPESIVDIGTSAFQGCSDLTKINIPYGVEIIYSRAFLGTSISDIVFPESLLKIGESAFQGCKNITSVVFPASLTHLYSSAFKESGIKEAVFLKKTNWELVDGIQPSEFSVDDAVRNAEFLTTQDYYVLRQIGTI